MAVKPSIRPSLRVIGVRLQDVAGRGSRDRQPHRAVQLHAVDLEEQLVVDGIAMVIHMTRREGRRLVEEAAVVNGYDTETNTWDIQRLDRVTV